MPQRYAGTGATACVAAPEPEAAGLSPRAQLPAPQQRLRFAARRDEHLSGSFSQAPRLRWIAHAGLASSHPGGAPTRETLAHALRIHVDWIELDVRLSRDGRLVLRHDRRLPCGRRVEELTTAELRARCGGVLSLDDAVEVVGGRVPIVLDTKGPGVARVLGGWLARRRDPEAFAVCGAPADLRELRNRARRVARWRTLPGIPDGASPWARALAGVAWRRRDPRGLLPLAGGVVSAARAPRHRRHELLHVAALLCRRDLPDQLGPLSREVGAAGVVVAHRAISPELCEAASRLRLPVAAWTVNRLEAARQVLGCGVGIIVSDRVVPLRLGLAGYGD
jgi:glycerophosphoryl diester phosphodiesterase